MINIDKQSGRLSVALPGQELDDLRARLRATRWPDEVEGAGWNYGTNAAYLKELVAFWADGFDWRAQESWINTFENYKAVVDGQGIHYVHARSPDPQAIPLLLLHGWPGSFLQMLKIIPLLCDPAKHRFDDGPAFHVVAASLPGYGFSDAATAPGMAMERIADLMSTLMREVLGYQRYGARGSDLGGTVIDQLARHHGEELIGIHLSQLIVAGGAPAPGDATEAERAFLQASAAMAMGELGYARMHASKPQTLAYALNDSPAGLAAWIVEKYRAWGDTGGDVESRFSRDYLLSTLTTYWATQSINSSMRLYYEMVRNRGSTAHIDTPTGFLMSRRDMFPAAPREWAERGYRVEHWSETDKGGHFLEWEEPELTARDIQRFFSRLRQHRAD